MSVLCDQVQNAIWHAFISLDDSEKGNVPKSRLTVLTASLGTLLGCQGVEKGLQEHRSTSYLKYNDFMFYLQKEVFSSLPNQISTKDMKKNHYEIEDMCWLVCKEKYCPIDMSFPENYHFKLFRIFCMLGEYYQIKKHCKVVMNQEEVKFVIQTYDKALGKESENEGCLSSLFGTTPNYTFSEFLTLIKNKYIHLENKAVLEATEEIYETLVENIIKKGHLKKTISPVGPWWEMWFVLKQHSLSWYSSKSQLDTWGEIQFYNCKVEVSNGKGCQFIMRSGSKMMALCAEDCRSKLQWISALNIAIKHSQTVEPYQQYCAAKRRQQRIITQAKQAEEELLLTQQKEALQTEKEIRNKLEFMLHEENRKRKELEDKEKQLQKQLEEEKQAKRDEEIVRNLQSRLLAEEWERRENLERQQAKQESELKEERWKRKQLEKWQQERQAEVQQLEDVVTNLEREKEQLHGTLKKTKMMLAVTAKQSSETKSCPPLQRAVSADFTRHIKSGQWIVPMVPSSVDINISEGDRT